MQKTMMEKWGNPKQKMFGLPQFMIWFMFFITITAIAVLTAYYPVWANIPLNVIAGVLVLVFCKPVMFERMKLTTLLVLRALVVFAFIGIFAREYYVLIVKIFLIINIVEATMTDLLKNKQYFNFVSGIAVGVAVLGLSGTWDLSNPMYTMEGAALWATIAYIVAYTIWNWIFVSGEFSTAVSTMHFGFLGAPILASVVFGPAYWLLFRANSLTFGGILQIAGKDYWEENLHSDKISKIIDFTHKTWVQVVCMIINVALCVAIMVVAFV